MSIHRAHLDPFDPAARPDDSRTDSRWKLRGTVHAEVRTPSEESLGLEMPRELSEALLSAPEEPGAGEPGDEAATRGDEDAASVAAVLAGDCDAFEMLVWRYQRQAVVVSFRLLGNQDDARDVVQDALIKAYRSLDTLERPAAFGGWLMRIVTNLSLNYRRGRSLRIAQPIDGAVADQLGNPAAADRPMRGHGSDSLTQGVDPSRAAEGRELGIALRQALLELPEKQRQALILFTVQELPQKEVALRLQCSVEAVKWHVFQARKKLRDMLKDTM